MTDTPKSAEFLTSDQVIQRLLSQPALRRRAATCILPAVRVENEWCFRTRDLEHWIAQEIGPQPTQSGSPA